MAKHAAFIAAFLITFTSLFCGVSSVVAQPTPYTVQDVGSDSPIDCDFAHFNYCQSEATLASNTSFTPLSNPVRNTVVHFSYRGTGWSGYLLWPGNVRASSAGSISNNPHLVQYAQYFALGAWDQDFFFDGTNYIAETPGYIEAGAGTFGWLFTNYLAVDGIAYGLVQRPTITGNTSFNLETAYMWTPLVEASANVTLNTSNIFSAAIDLIQDSVGGHVVEFLPPTGSSLIWATPTGAPPSLNTAPYGHTVFLFYAASSTLIVGVPIGTPLPLTASVGLGNSELAAGQCVSTNVEIPGATIGDVVQITPSSDPNANPSVGIFFWNGIVTASDNVLVKLCALSAGTPAAEIYNVRIIE